MSDSANSAERVLERLEWTVIRRLDGLLQGDYRTLFRGFGLDLADLREYQYSDDVRYIDWNVTARLDTPYVRQYNEDREITAWFLLDLSPSVDFGSSGVRKRELLNSFAGVLARLLTRHGNRVGAVLYSGAFGHSGAVDRGAAAGAADLVVPPRSGRQHVLYLLHLLLNRASPERAQPTNLTDLLGAGMDLVKRRSLVFVVSDFLSTPGWERPLLQLSRRHEVIAIRLLDPLEMEMPDLGMLVMRDSESGEQLFVDTHDRGFRERFADLAQKREQLLRRSFVEAGVDALELSTRDDLAEAILRFASMRKLRSSTSAGAPAARAARAISSGGTG